MINKAVMVKCDTEGCDSVLIFDLEDWEMNSFVLLKKSGWGIERGLFEELHCCSLCKDVQGMAINTIYFAAAKGDLTTVKSLMDCASPFEKNYALFFAAKHNQIKVADYLVGSGVAPNAHGALLAAAAGGHIEMFNLLVQMGADISDNNYKAFHNAVNGRHNEIVKKILKIKDMSWIVEKYAKRGEIDKVKYLIKMGLDSKNVDLSKIFL